MTASSEVQIFPQANFKGDVSKCTVGTFTFKEPFTQNELLGKTFHILSVQVDSNDKRYAVDSGAYGFGSTTYMYLRPYDPANMNQIFAMLPDKTIKCINNGFHLSAEGSKPMNGARIHNYPKRNTLGQCWVYSENDKTLKVYGTDLAMTVVNERSLNKSPLMTLRANGSISQQWDLQLCDVRGVDPLTKEPYIYRFMNNVPSSRNESSSVVVPDISSAILSTSYATASTSASLATIANSVSLSRANSTASGNASASSTLPSSISSDNILPDKPGLNNDGKNPVLNQGLVMEQNESATPNAVIPLTEAASLETFNSRTRTPDLNSIVVKYNEPRVGSKEYNEQVIATLLNCADKSFIAKSYTNAETYNSCQAKLFEHIDQGGASTGWVGIGDYDMNKFAVDGKYSTQLADIGDFKYWVGKKFKLKLKFGAIEYVWDDRSFHKNGQGNDSKIVNIWKPDDSTNQCWSVDSYGHLFIADKPEAILGYGDQRNKNYPLMIMTNNRLKDNNCWKLTGNTITPINNASLRLGANVKVLPKDKDRIAYTTSNTYSKWELVETGYAQVGNETVGYFKNKDLSSASIAPFTDLILYENANHQGKLLRFHNGKPAIWNANFDDFNDMVSSYKVRPALNDNMQTKDSSDTSGNTVCDIRYRVYDYKGNGSPSAWFKNGEQATVSGGICGVEFEYTGPGQIFARKSPASSGYGWGSNGQLIGKTKSAFKVATESMKGLAVKIEGVSNVNLALDIQDSTNAWKTNIASASSSGVLIDANCGTKYLRGIKITVSTNSNTTVSASGATKEVPPPTITTPKVTVTPIDPGLLSSFIDKPFGIKSRKNASFALTVDKTAEGGKLVIQQRKPGIDSSQSFTVDKEGHLRLWFNRNLVIRSTGTPMLVDATKSDNSSSNESKWQLNSSGQLVSMANTNQGLDVSGGTMSNNVAVIMYGLHGGANQQWDIDTNFTDGPIDIGEFKKYVGKEFVVRSRKDKNFVLDHYGLNNNGVFKIYQFTQGTPNQTMTVDSDGRISMWTNKDKVLYAETTNNNAKIMFVPRSDPKANTMLAKWTMTDKGVICLAKSVNKVLDVSGGNMKNDNPVILWDANGQNNQQWDIDVQGIAQALIPPAQTKPENIGKFKDLVGKPFVLRSRKDNKYVMTIEMTKSSPMIMIAQRKPGMDETQTFTVDELGRIAQSNIKGSYLKVADANDGTRPCFINTNNTGVTDLPFGKWIMSDDNVIQLADNTRKCLDVSDGMMKDDQPIVLRTVNGQNNQQWDIDTTFTTDQKPANPVVSELQKARSFIIPPLHELVVYETLANPGRKYNSLVIHNGSNVRNQEISNISIYGIKTVMKVEVKKIDKADNLQTVKVVTKEAFSAFSTDGLYTREAIIIISLVVAACIAYVLFFRTNWFENTNYRIKDSTDEWLDDKWNSMNFV